MITGGDISKYRPAQPPVRCRHCSHVKGEGKPDKVKSTALHFGMPPSRYGVLLIRVECHGEKQDIAATFKWLESNQGRPIDAFSDQPNDYGLRDMVERDGYSLPTNLQQCRYQLEAPKSPIADIMGRLRDCLKVGKACGYDQTERLRYGNALEDLDLLAAAIGAENRATGKTETYGKYVLSRFVARMDAEIVANEHKGDWNKWRPDIKEMCREIAHHAQKLGAIIKRSESSAVSTGPVTELCADLANVAMKCYEVFGTPVQRPGKWIDDALPNAARGTDRDLPMRSKAIDIKPDFGHIEYRADDLRLRCARCQCLESSEEWQKECPGLVLESSSQVALGSGLPGDQGYQ